MSQCLILPNILLSDDRLVLITSLSARSSWLDLQDHGLGRWEYTCEVLRCGVLRAVLMTQTGRGFLKRVAGRVENPVIGGFF